MSFELNTGDRAWQLLLKKKGLMLGVLARLLKIDSKVLFYYHLPITSLLGEKPS